MTRWIDETLHPAWRVSLKADRILFEERTAHQHLVVFDNAQFGRVMMLDGVVQLSTADEYMYHEMMAHVPLLALDAARRVLIIGGGDGGVLREVLKHGVSHVTLCELDRTVIDVSLAHLPEISAGAFDDPRTRIVIADGVKFVAETDERFDAIIVDSTEPIGPAAVLFTEGFFAGCARILERPGIMITQNGLPFAHPDHLAASARLLTRLFADAAPYLVGQPCYFGGPFALAFAANDAALRQLPPAALDERFAAAGVTTRYYTPEVHRAAFALPRYIADNWAAAARG